MKVSVYSREAIESIIAEGKFPENTAVISFYDPAIKRIDEDYSHIDYNGVCNTVFYSELDDLDLDVLERKGYTYDTYFPEAPDIATFIYRAYDNGMDIICQCEYGQSRSAATAAAILEHFHHNGISIFTNYNYYPNQVVYHKIFDALEKQKRYHDNYYYYAVDTETMRSHITKLQLPESLLSDYSRDNGNSAADLKFEIEKVLSERNILYHTAEEIMNALLKNKQPIYASFTAKNPSYIYDGCLWYFYAYAVRTYFKYGSEKISVEIWLNKYYSSSSNIIYKNKWHRDNYCFGFRPIDSLSFFGKLSWDSERKMIDAVPLIITNIQQ